jgi:hypothetical protein
MKIITVLLSKPGATARAEIRYKDASWPVQIDWSGEQKAFRLRDGSPIHLGASLDRLPEIVAHQASQAAATFEIQDNGGEAPMRTDNLVGN